MKNKTWLQQQHKKSNNANNVNPLSVAEFDLFIVLDPKGGTLEGRDPCCLV